jgi:hypothetical protein
MLASVSSAHRSAMSALLRVAAADPAEELVKVSLREIPSTSYPKILAQWGEAVAAFQPLFAIPEPYRHLVRSVDQTAAEVQGRLMRAIHRHGPFVDSGEAFRFAAAALQHADRQIYRELQARRIANETCVSRSGRFAPVSVRP